MLKGIIVYREEYCGYFNSICKFVARNRHEKDEAYDIVGTVINLIQYILESLLTVPESK